MRKSIILMVLAAFFTNSFVPPSFAQALASKPGEMVALSPAVNAPVFKGIKIYADDPLRFDFILDRGDMAQGADPDAALLVKYFLAALTVPNKDLWVNLSPYEKDRIVPDAFGRTQMGRDLLAQDYFLKQLTASLIYPENELGREFWSRVYKEAQEQFGTSDIPVDTFNKVWIVPATARVYENGSSAYVVESRLKVMLESDYLAMDHNGVGVDLVSAHERADIKSSPTQELTQDILRQAIIPALEKEVNEGASFSQVRQAYNSLILALWYKKKVKNGILAASYVDRKKIRGVNINDPREAEKIWAQYVEAFKKGAFDLIKEEEDPLTREMIPRKYFSGGLGFDQAEKVFDMSAERSEINLTPQAQVVAFNLEPDVPVTPKTTWSGRKEVVSEFLFSDGFRAVTGLDLRQGEYLIHDIGVGATPTTTIELNAFSKGMNEGISVVGSELKKAAVRYQIDLHKGVAFEELRKMILRRMPELGENVIRTVSFLVTDSGLEAFAGVSEVLITFDGQMNGIYALYSIPVAVAPSLDYQTRQSKPKFDDMRRNGSLFIDVMSYFGADTIKVLINALDDGEMSKAVNDGELVIRREPVRTMLEREGIQFVETDGQTSSVKDADVVIASNVVLHLTDEQRVPFFQSALDQLREGGVLIVENAEFWVADMVEQVDVYQKNGGNRDYLGSFVYANKTSVPLTAEEFSEYKKVVEQEIAAQGASRETVLGYPFEDGIKYLFDAAELFMLEAQIKEVSKQEIVRFALTEEEILILKKWKSFLDQGGEPEKAFWRRLMALSQKIKDGVPVMIDLSRIPNDASSVKMVQLLLLEMSLTLDDIFRDFMRYNQISSTTTLTIMELIKNAIIHGNKTDLKQPLYVWIKYGASVGEMNKIYVIDMGVEDDGPGLTSVYKDLKLTGGNAGIDTIKQFGSYQRGNLAFKGKALQAKYSVATVLDAAQAGDPVDRAAATGGIDFQPAEDILQNDGPGIQFKMPAGMEAMDWNSIQGYTPVIIGIQPLKDLPQFLGTN